MQRKRLFLVLMISCICLLPIDAEAQAGAVGKILKGTAKAAKSHSYEFSRAGIVAEKYGRNNYPNRKHDSTYWDSLNRIRPIYMDSSKKWDSSNKYRFPSMDSTLKWNSLRANRANDERYTNKFEQYRELDADDFVDEYSRGRRIDDFVVLESRADSVKTKVDINNNSKSKMTTYYSEKNEGFAWKLSLGLLILIVAIICCTLKLFSKKGKTK